MPFPVVLDETYGYVIGTGVSSVFLLLYLGGKVGEGRTKFGVAYPTLYADNAEAKVDKNKHLFNCYQRAHQNTLESYPYLIFTLFIGGIKHPLIAAAGGLAWIVGRYFFAHGYYTGDPKTDFGEVLSTWEC